MTGPGRAEIGVFGGSGFSSFLDDAEVVDVETPYGAPSAPITVATVAGRQVAFLPRHGPRHELAPHAIPYRANVWAMRELGVGCLISPGAVGSLAPTSTRASSSSSTSSSTARGAGPTRFHGDFAAGVVHVASPTRSTTGCGPCCSTPAARKA